MRDQLGVSPPLPRNIGSGASIERRFVPAKVATTVQIAELELHGDRNIPRFQGIVGFAKNKFNLGFFEVPGIDHCRGNRKLNQLCASSVDKGDVIHGLLRQGLRYVGPAIRQDLCDDYRVRARSVLFAKGHGSLNIRPIVPVRTHREAGCGGLRPCRKRKDGGHAKQDYRKIVFQVGPLKEI